MEIGFINPGPNHHTWNPSTVPRLNRHSQKNHATSNHNLYFERCFQYILRCYKVWRKLPFPIVYISF